MSRLSPISFLSQECIDLWDFKDRRFFLIFAVTHYVVTLLHDTVKFKTIIHAASRLQKKKRNCKKLLTVSKSFGDSRITPMQPIDAITNINKPVTIKTIGGPVAFWSRK